MAECLTSAQTRNDRDDVRSIFESNLIGDFAVKLKDLTPDNAQLMQTKIERVAAYAKLSLDVSHTAKAWHESEDKLGANSAEAVAAKKVYDEALDAYHVGEAQMGVSDLEIIKQNDPGLEEPKNLRAAILNINFARKYVHSNELPYSKQEMIDIVARDKAA